MNIKNTHTLSLTHTLSDAYFSRRYATPNGGWSDEKIREWLPKTDKVDKKGIKYKPPRRKSNLVT